ncbi:hypothetical protein BGZ46_006159 [Entomortierella lignicola]|nr:hypothetical protein BGZ46_006159 [Entomortierella lignicola]
MFLVAARHRHSLSSTLMKGLSATVDRLGTQAILSSIRDIQVVQAFELLLAHEPSLVGTYNSGDESEQAQRAAGLAGESLLTNAISISKDLGLDKSIYELYKHLNNPQGKPQTNKISELLISSSLWLNLRIWDGHYVFFKPKNRVLRDLDDLARVSTCMIAIDELGNKLGTNSNSNVENFESNQKDKTENQLRAAGRTLLSHRIRAMAAIHGALSKITDILDFANDDEDLSQTHTSSQQKQPPTTTPQVKDEVVGAVLSVFEERYTIEQCMQMDMIHFTTLNSAHLAEEWVQLELNSNLSMLCTIGICSLYAGRADTGFTTKLFLEALQQDEKLRDCIALLGKNRLELSERVVSSFAFFNRRPTISSTASDAPKKTAGVIELTGAPYFLTCAFVVDACRLFLEGTAFVLVTYHSIQKNFDSRLLSMIQAAQRLEEFDGNRYCQVEGGDNPHNGTTKPPLSICQLGAKFIRDMIETLQKWKLSSSMHRKPELIGPWGDRKTSASRAHARINRDTPDNSTEDVGTPESTLYSSSPGPNHDSDTLTPRRKSTTQFAMMPNGHSLAPQPPGGALDMTIQSSNHYPNFMPSYLYSVHPQTGFVYPMQPWQPEAGNTKVYGSMENILTGTIPDATTVASDIGGTFDITLLDSYLDSLFQH